MKVMEDRYKKYLEKAKSVSLPSLRFVQLVFIVLLFHGLMFQLFQFIWLLLFGLEFFDLIMAQRNLFTIHTLPCKVIVEDPSLILVVLSFLLKLFSCIISGHKNIGSQAKCRISTRGELLFSLCVSSMLKLVGLYRIK